ncbi:hypothetical protein [uncultured Desulfobulbus sp.]|uniref:hypothetical protein n=1 Tax=uncultured Desulfobulbus sp. TaxID=239745 RepID=UPI0029C760F9|nr:hypothetical protein [uncultured Desulfobulbus sp.]
MAQKQAKVIKKNGRRTPTAKLIDVRSPLAKQMLHLVVQFDLAYDHLKAHWKEIGGIPEQEVGAHGQCSKGGARVLSLYGGV